MVTITEGQAYWSIDPKFIIDIARQIYWFENKQPDAIDILNCFNGISEKQIDMILRGNATLTSTHQGIKFSEFENKEFKHNLKKHIEYLNSKYIDIGGKRVPKDILMEYGIHVVKRLRDVMRSGPKPMELFEIVDIMSLEHQRQLLHKRILEAVGFKEDDKSDDYYRFSQALSDWLDKHAGSLYDL